MCFCDDNPPEVFSAVTRRAAKEHRCYECGKTIAKGDLYRVSSGVWDGGPESFKWCDTCTTIANLIESYDADTRRAWREAAAKKRGWSYGPPEAFCFTFGNLLECASEYLREATQAPSDSEGATR